MRRPARRPGQHGRDALGRERPAPSRRAGGAEGLCLLAEKSGAFEAYVDWIRALVAKGDRHGVCLAVVPGDAQLDLKALARVTGDRKVDTVPLKDVQPLTGYVRGGVTALSGKKDYPTFVDETIHLFDVVSISAGQRGLQIVIAPDDYLRVTKGVLGAIAKAKGSS